MKQQIESIIKKNLPEKKEHDWSKDEHTKTCKDGCTYCCNADGMITGFNQALSQINTSLIADEVLKVVVEKIREKIEDLPTLYNSIEHLIAKDDILDLLDNLSPNKENKNNG